MKAFAVVLLSTSPLWVALRYFSSDIHHMFGAVVGYFRQLLNFYLGW